MPRYFFALWPDAYVRERIIAYRSTAAPAGKLTRTQNLHITLLFLGMLNTNQVAAVISAAMNIKRPDFSLKLNQYGHFRKSKVCWLGMQKIPELLVLLHNDLLACVQKIPLSVDCRPYHPHLTLARKSPPVKKRTIAPIDWSVKQFVLIESTDTPDGVHYRVIKNFPLQTLEE